MVRILKSTRRRGLSVAETIAATSLLCLLLISVVNIFPAVLTTVELTRQRNTANLLAHDALEVVAARPFGGLEIGAQDVSTIPVPTNFTLSVEAFEVDEYESEFLLGLRSRVSWQYRDQTREVVQELYVHPARS